MVIIGLIFFGIAHRLRTYILVRNSGAARARRPKETETMRSGRQETRRTQ